MRGVFGLSSESYNATMKKATLPPVASVGVRELKNGLSAHLELVKAGQEFTVTDRGRPVARLIPVSAATDVVSELIAAGLVQPPMAARRLPAKHVVVDGKDLDAAIAAERR